MTKRTRLKLTIAVGVYLMIIGLIATIKGMETIVITVIPALTGTVMTYIFNETKRSSNQKNDNV